MNDNHSGRPMTVRNNTNHDIVMESILRSPKKSMIHLAYALKISNTTVRRIIRSYKIHVLHTPQPTDLEARKVYCSTMLAQAYVGEDLLGNIWWSAERHIVLNGHVNTQNVSKDHYIQRN